VKKNFIAFGVEVMFVKLRASRDLVEDQDIVHNRLGRINSSPIQQLLIVMLDT
jgi:hypothetical protein